ncbi:MAG: nucleotidyltransferase domain-containing protein [Planctomycetes bacterium]|nr:nucleotidyltransferase domain-containing protein [Planctomycetota bacterium]
MVESDTTLNSIVREQPYPLLFVTLSGAHLYGFPSPDSDFDLRGVHVLPAQEALGLGPCKETIERSQVRDGREIDLVTHDVKKFFLLMLKKNGYVLEQVYSPLVVYSTPEHEELKAVAAGCITRYHLYHYLGFAETQWKLLTKESPPRVKPLLYVYRVLFTGIHLMRTGSVEANLLRLNEVFRHPVIADLVARKLEGPERATLPDAEMPYHEAEYHRLRAELAEAGRTSTLPEAPSARAALNDLLVCVRMNGVRRR